MASIRHYALRCAICMLWVDVHLWSPRHDSDLCESIRLYERNRRHHPDPLPVQCALVREPLRIGTRKLFHTWITSWPRCDRQVVRHRSLHINLHRLSAGVRCIPVTTLRKRDHRGIVHVPHVSKAPAIVCALHSVDVVRDHVFEPSLRD